MTEPPPDSGMFLWAEHDVCNPVRPLDILVPQGSHSGLEPRGDVRRDHVIHVGSCLRHHRLGHPAQLCDRCDPGIA